MNYNILHTGNEFDSFLCNTNMGWVTEASTI